MASENPSSRTSMATRAASAAANRARRSPERVQEKRRGTGRTGRGRETRERLVAAARVVFERDGFLHARVTDICDEAGLSHGSFYTYFLSKEEVFKEIADAVEVDLLQVHSARGTSRVDRIRAANRHYLQSYRTNARFLQVINQVASFDHEVQVMHTERQRAFAHAIERRIREYQAEGVADPRLDPLFAANALGGMVTSMAEELFIHDMAGDFDAAVEQLTTLWVNAIGLK